MINPQFVVDGHTFDDPDSDLAGDGQFAPFMIFMPAEQDYLHGTFATRAEAERWIADGARWSENVGSPDNIERK